jgi:proteasome lid subunit RPN8/RPN11
VPERWIFSHYEAKPLSPRLTERVFKTKGIPNRIENKQIAQYLEIGKYVYDEIIDYCKNALPYEACGLLSGVKEEAGNTIWKLKNESLKQNRFYMSKEAVNNTIIKISENGEKLTGIFHSHPTSQAYPSTQDIENNPYDHIAYLIVSFYKGKVEVGCFKMNNKRVIPLNLIITDE